MLLAYKNTRQAGEPCRGPPIHLCREPNRQPRGAGLEVVSISTVTPAERASAAVARSALRDVGLHRIYVSFLVVAQSVRVFVLLR